MQGSATLRADARNAGAFGIGVIAPALVLSGALAIAAGMALREPPGQAFPLAAASGLVVAVVLEAMRRYAIATYPSRGRTAVAVLRGLVRLVALAALPVNVLVTAGLVTRCYGQACGAIPMALLDFVLTWCLVSLACIPFGYRLLGRAAWLRPR